MSTLTPEQEVEARTLADAIAGASADDLLMLARLLVGKPTAQVFGGAAMLVVLQQLQAPRRYAVKQAYQEALTYFTNHQGRMDYPYYRAQGWQIGSGPVESGCKTVVAQRMKLAGMRWREYGTDGVCHLRALFKSDKGQWDAFWERKVNKSPINYQRISR